MIQIVCDRCQAVAKIGRTGGSELLKRRRGIGKNETCYVVGPIPSGWKDFRDTDLCPTCANVLIEIEARHPERQGEQRERSLADFYGLSWEAFIEEYPLGDLVY